MKLTFRKKDVELELYRKLSPVKRTYTYLPGKSDPAFSPFIKSLSLLFALESVLLIMWKGERFETITKEDRIRFDKLFQLRYPVIQSSLSDYDLQKSSDQFSTVTGSTYLGESLAYPSLKSLDGVKESPTGRFRTDNLGGISGSRVQVSTFTEIGGEMTETTHPDEASNSTVYEFQCPGTVRKAYNAITTDNCQVNSNQEKDNDKNNKANVTFLNILKSIIEKGYQIMRTGYFKSSFTRPYLLA